LRKQTQARHTPVREEIEQQIVRGAIIILAVALARKGLR
jgi:hypothetical protein